MNRTLISNGTNNRIKDKAPHTYLDDSEVFARPPEILLPDHFINAVGIEKLRAAREDLAPDEVGVLYEQFCAAREAGIIQEIRKVCQVQMGKTPLQEGLAED